MLNKILTGCIFIFESELSPFFAKSVHLYYNIHENQFSRSWYCFMIMSEKNAEITRYFHSV